MIIMEQVMAHRLGEALDQLEAQFSKLDPEVLPQEERQRGMAKLRAETDTNFARCSHKLKTTLLGALKVPAHLLHPADLEQGNPATPEEVEALKQEVEGLRQQLQNEKYMKIRCEAQLKNIEKALEEQRKVLSGPLSGEAMSKVKEAKERLCFMRDNQDDLLRATLEVREATQDLLKDSCPSSGMLLTQEGFQ